MDKPLVSVLIPVYNGMPMIKASLASLVDQTYDNWECIIVDDGSTDGTSEYLDSLSDKRFVIHHFEKNCGRPVARQKTLDLATGKYIAILDADDIFASQKLEFQVKAMEENPDVDLCTCLTCSFGLNTHELRVRGDINEYPMSFHPGKTFAHGTCVFRAEKAKKIKYNPSLKLSQDYDFIQRYLKDGKFISVNKVLFYYNEYDSVSKSKMKKTDIFLYKQKFANNEYRIGVKLFIKYIFLSLLVYPFFSTKTLLLRRGRKVTDSERLEFSKNINKYKKQINI